MGGDTELSGREKAFIDVSVAATINCPYCIYFHTEETWLSGVTDEELRKTANLTADMKYFSAVLHGNETNLGRFKAETNEIVEYITKQ